MKPAVTATLNRSCERATTDEPKRWSSQVLENLPEGVAQKARRHGHLPQAALPVQRIAPPSSWRPSG